MKISPLNTPGSCKTGRLVNVDVILINSVLGFEPNVEDDPYKVKHSWGFYADGKRCGIWDYKGSERYGEFSTYGSHDVFEKLFGSNYEK